MRLLASAENEDERGTPQFPDRDGECDWVQSSRLGVRVDCRESVSA